MNRITEFKNFHKRFIEAMQYIIINEEKLKADPIRWQKIKNNFETKFSYPMDEAWLALSKEEKKRLAPLYLFRKVQEDETVKKILDKFGGKIISVKEE